MKLLLLDDDYITIEQIKCLIDLESDWQLVQNDEIDFNEIDLVVVDVFNNKYKKLLENILEINPKVRTLTISDQLTSNSSKGCEYCDRNFNRIRLVKPLKLKQLYDTIKNFDKISTCPLMDAFHNLENLIPIIIKQFKNLFYDEQSKVISSTSNTESKEHTMQILGLLALLDQNQIRYTLLDESSVKIDI